MLDLERKSITELANLIAEIVGYEEELFSIPIDLTEHQSYLIFQNLIHLDGEAQSNYEMESKVPINIVKIKSLVKVEVFRTMKKLCNEFWFNAEMSKSCLVEENSK